MKFHWFDLFMLFLSRIFFRPFAAEKSFKIKCLFIRYTFIFSALPISTISSRIPLPSVKALTLALIPDLFSDLEISLSLDSETFVSLDWAFSGGVDSLNALWKQSWSSSVIFSYAMSAFFHVNCFDFFSCHLCMTLCCPFPSHCKKVWVLDLCYRFCRSYQTFWNLCCYLRIQL